MRTKRHAVHVVAFLIATLFSACMAGQEHEMSIFTPGVRVSPDDRYLAFFAGPRPPGGASPRSEWSRLFVIDFDTNEVICCQHLTPAGFALAWEPSGAARLFVEEDLLGATGTYRTGLVGLPPSEKFAPGVIQEFEAESEPIASYEILVLAWNPNGQILAAGCGLADIHLSFDGGKSFVPTNTARRTFHLVWATNDTLLAMTWTGRGSDNRISELKIGTHGVDSMRTVAEGPKLLLDGVLDGRGIYHTEHDVHLGDAVFIHSENRIGTVVANGKYVGVTLWPAEGDGQILIYDSQRKVVGRRSIPRATTLMAISAKRQCMYVVERRPCEIHSYGFTEDSKASTTWKIPQVQIPQEDSSKASIQGSTPRP